MPKPEHTQTPLDEIADRLQAVLDGNPLSVKDLADLVQTLTVISRSHDALVSALVKAEAAINLLTCNGAYHHGSPTDALKQARAALAAAEGEK